MTITHHPSDPTLAAFAAGTLDEGRALTVATHLVTCPVCRKAARAYEGLRGVAMIEARPSPMAAAALQRALRALSADEGPPARKRDAAPSEWPAPLSSYPLEPWRWIGSGVHWRSVGVPKEQGTRVFMLKAAPGIRLPHHQHSGIEWTSVLQGAFHHQHGRYAAGDFDEADETVDHLPVIEDGMECICLVALQGQIKFKGWIGRMLQPFVRI